MHFIYARHRDTQGARACMITHTQASAHTPAIRAHARTSAQMHIVTDRRNMFTRDTRTHTPHTHACTRWHSQDRWAHPHTYKGHGCQRSQGEVAGLPAMLEGAVIVFPRFCHQLAVSALPAAPTAWPGKGCSTAARGRLDGSKMHHDEPAAGPLYTPPPAHEWQAWCTITTFAPTTACHQGPA